MPAVLSAVPRAFGPFDSVVVHASDLVASLATLLAPMAGAQAAAAAIIVVTIALRLLLSPLTWLQIRAEVRRTALAPQVRQLRRRHADDPQRLAAETMALYRSAGASPFAGCLPALAQAPFFVLMYQLVTRPADAGGGLLADSFLGVGLGSHLGQVSSVTEAGVFGLLLVVVALAARSMSRRMRRTLAAQADSTSGPAESRDGSPGTTAAESVTASVGRLLPLLPYAMVVIVLVVPLAAGLYLATTTGWTAIEQAVLRRAVTSTEVDKDGSATYNS
ncbi:YidC/Oxa1 family membrane protein insertase [Micromonospora sp. NBC_01813]|uniref:YidC/Oxa1 family membrane protein insertase n=1 Tax=Micromonospora sp. NBC_01813 TaxID=2975988 RepID=UPI002DD7FDD0|nr:YidC/Oxa1 family membrane protein insertase [Micromonospora sp. NBC_01813]WSA12160.1 YidC/Oxa1 family membrane protein insertase [Micromonospora sp. NBC_01813]